MGTYKRGNHYWGEKQENLVLAWVSATTENEFTRIYGELLPALNFMGELILNRYFTVPYHRQTQIKKEAIQEVFLKLKQYNPKKVVNKNGGYSFCSLLIKHFYMEELVLLRGKKAQEYFELTDEFPENAQTVDYGENIEFDKDAVIRRFKIIRKEMAAKLKKFRKSRGNNQAIGKRFEKYVEILDLSIEFIDKYNSLNPPALADYIFLHQKKNLITKKTIVYYFRLLFGITITVNMDGNDTETGIDNKYYWFEDDYAPNDRKWAKRQHKVRHKPDVQYKFL